MTAKVQSNKDESDWILSAIK